MAYEWRVFQVLIQVLQVLVPLPELRLERHWYVRLEARVARLHEHRMREVL